MTAMQPTNVPATADTVTPAGLCAYGFQSTTARECYNPATRVVRYTAAVGTPPRTSDTHYCDDHADKALTLARHTDVTRH